mmetsp:Transcript_1648/g.3607  ORF Transcript_1648/g.3607 Transcript_1648/m.3607 type:complete len:578 (-) Transcript_1648:73-1806(-)
MSEVVLASCSDGQGILATDLRTGALVSTFEDVAAQPAAYGQIGEGSSYIYAVQSAKAIWQAWAWGDKKPTYRASLPEKTTAMAFSPEATLCFAGSVAGTIMVWQMGTGCLLRSWPAHFREVTQLLVSSDGSFLVSASADANVHVYNIADIFVHSTPKPFQSWSGHSLPVTALALLPGRGLQQIVASASLDRSLRLWDLGSGQALSTRSLSSPINSIAAGPTGSDILCACKNGELRIVDISACNKESESSLLLGHSGSVLSCAISSDGSQAVSCSEADKVRIWDVRTHQCISQAHTTRNVRINAVQIMRRWVSPQPLPAFKPFQRLLTKPEEVKPVPLGVTGRELALQEALAEETSEASGTAALAEADLGDGENESLQQRLARVEEERARWAKVAADLYGMIVQGGISLPAAKAPATAVEAPAPPSASEKGPNGSAAASSSSSGHRKIEENEGEEESPERKRARPDDATQPSSTPAVAKAKAKAAIAKQKPRGSTPSDAAAAATGAAAVSITTAAAAVASSASAAPAAADSDEEDEDEAEVAPTASSKTQKKSKVDASKKASAKAEKKKGKKKKLTKA